MNYAYVIWDENKFKDFHILKNKFIIGEEVVEDWKFHETSIKKGDRIFVYKTKTKDMLGGFIASGYADSYRFKNEENGNHYVKIKFDYFADFENLQILSIEKINEILGGNSWLRQNSGHMLPEEKKYEIELAWSKTIGIKNNLFNLIKVSPDIDPDEHDGSYELVRKAIELYSQLDSAGLNSLDIKDIDVIYSLTIGTWAQGIDAKKISIDNSSLSDEQKLLLRTTLDNVTEKSRNREYQNHEDNKEFSIGMFGTGFLSFKGRISDAGVRTFIKACIDVKDLSNDEEIFDILNNAFLDDEISGDKVPSLSEMLHCLKPTSIPVINTRTIEIYKRLGIKLEKPKNTKCFIKNCKTIRDYRNINFDIKNYRCMDLNIENDLSGIGIYIVFQKGGKNGQFAKESAAGILQSPKKDKRGATPHYWKKMENVKKDSLIFHMSKQNIVAVSVVQQENYDSSGQTYNVKTNYTKLNNKLNLNKYRDQIIDECKGIKEAPFNKNGQGKQGYLFDMPLGLSDIFIDEILETNQDQDLLFLKDYKSKMTNTSKEILKGAIEMTDRIIPLNTILYGPPGTGKTYKSKYYAVAICDYDGDIGLTMKKYPKYEDLIKRYNELEKEKRIAFSTFHQSYSYEEFIEGIKPVISDDDCKEITYNIISGVFKNFCNDAVISDQEIQSIGIDENASIWKMSLYGGKNNIVQECFDENVVRIGFDKDSNDNSYIIFTDKMQKGDIILSLKSFYEINGIAQILDDEILDLQDKSEFRIARRVKWLFKNKIINIKDMNGGKRLPIKTCSGLPNIDRIEIFNIIQNNIDYHNSLDKKEVKKKNYVFIIDEINRGNISKIFGELITLIEPSKRAGAKESMSCTLPYSGKKFSVPNNVYVIGTMNTADRSIALMDTALRRRFDFIEMMPDTNVVKGKIVDGVNIEELLRVINARIEVLFDREHTIGHSFFTNLDSGSTVSDLASIFKNKIIPLLQEYFYEDYGKIRLILGDNDKSKPEKNQFIREIMIETNIFKGNVSKDDIAEYKYIINEEAFNDIESYKLIY